MAEAARSDTERGMRTAPEVIAPAGAPAVAPAPAWVRWTLGAAQRQDPRVRRRLFCLPHAGGSGAEFRDWAAVFPPEIDVCPLQLPGRAGRWSEPPVSSMAALVRDMASDLRPLLAVPFALFGHSMGALLAFELARLLQRVGPGPVHLFVSGARAPHLPDPEPPLSELPDAAFLARLKKLNGFPAELRDHDEFLQLVLPMLRADVLLCETYEPTAGAPLDCPMTALGGMHDERVPRAHVAAWAGYTRNRFRLRYFPGDHFFVTTAWEAVARAVLTELVTTAPRGRS